MTIRKELLDELLPSMDSHEDFLGPDGLLNELTEMVGVPEPVTGGVLVT